MAHRWIGKGVLKLGSGPNKKIIEAGKEIPEDFILNPDLKLLKRFRTEIEEFVPETIIVPMPKKPKATNGDKK